MDETSAITFESLYDMVRKEKTNESIQKLPDDVYHLIIDYLKTKFMTYKNPDISPNEKEKILSQLKSARKLVKELYERRERKILQLAINKSRDKATQIDKTILLSEEISLMEEVIENLDRYRKGVLLNLVNGKMPDLKISEKSPAENITSSAHAERKNETSETIPQGRDATSISAEPIPVPNMARIEFTSDVPKFLGKDAEILGPFEKGDTADIDIDIAKVLIRKGRAREISSSAANTS